MSSIYEIIIYSFLILVGALALVCLRRRRFVVASILAVGWLIVFYGSFIEPRLLVTHQQKITLSENSDTLLKAALISDIHVGSYKSRDWVSRLVEKTNQQSPDIIFLAGDFIWEKTDAVEELAPLKELRAPLGIYAVLGNHDYDDSLTLLTSQGRTRAKLLTEKLEELGVEVLVNKGKILEHAGRSFVLLGTDDIWTGYADIGKALDTVPEIKTPAGEAMTRILVSHNPDIIHETHAREMDLILAGHTHGGQIRLPFIGSVPKIPTKLGNKYDRGLFAIDETQLFITSGVGETGPRARLFIPPEIAVLEIAL